MRNLGVGMLIAVLILGSTLIVIQPTIEANTPEGPPIAGERVIVIDANTGAILYERNASERAAPASLTKLFTALFAIENTPLQRRMTVESDDLVGEASAGLEAGENLSFETLLHGLLLASGNDSAMTIARNVGASESPSGLNGVTSFMTDANERIAGLGLRDTRLVNPHGLDEPGHYSSARDIAAITMHALRTQPDFLASISSPGYIAEEHHFVQSNALIGNYPGAIGGKTGITDDAGFCLMGIAQRDGHTIISVVMGSTQEAWYSDLMSLFDHGFATLAVPGLAASLPAVTLAITETMTAPIIQPASAQQLELHAVGVDATSVRSTRSSSATSWHIWRWPLGASLGMLVLFVCAVQTQSLIELQRRPRARGIRPRPTHARPALTRTEQRLPGETQPFTTSTKWDSSRSGFPIWSGSAGD